jgi:hypothetical protein
MWNPSKQVSRLFFFCVAGQKRDKRAIKNSLCVWEREREFFLTRSVQSSSTLFTHKFSLGYQGLFFSKKKKKGDGLKKYARCECVCSSRRDGERRGNSPARTHEGSRCFFWKKARHRCWV